MFENLAVILVETAPSVMTKEFCSFGPTIYIQFLASSFFYLSKGKLNLCVTCNNCNWESGAKECQLISQVPNCVEIIAYTTCPRQEVLWSLGVLQHQ